MTDDGPDVTRQIPWHDDIEAAATASSRHTYPRDERLAMVDQDVSRLADAAGRLGTWLLIVLVAAGCALGVLFGAVL